MPAGVPIPIQTKAEIIAAYKAGEEARHIAARFGVARSSVTMIAHRAGISRHTRRSNSAVRRREKGSPPVLTKELGEWVWTGGIARFVKRDSKVGAR